MMLYKLNQLYAKLNIFVILMGVICEAVEIQKQTYEEIPIVTQQSEYAVVPGLIDDEEILKQIALLKNDQEYKNLKNKQFLKKHKTRDYYYIGDWQNSVRKGRGILFSPGKFFYFGDFNKWPEGKGKLVLFADGYSYEGQVRAGKINGKGKLNHLNGDFTFEGVILDGKPTHGVLIVFGKKQPREQVFRVLLQNYPMNQAIITYKDNKKYEGYINLTHFMPQGKGQMDYPDHTKYNGSWMWGVYHGEGEFTWPDGSIYNGYYSNGKKEGLGKFVYPSKNYYVGNWVQGKQEGEGVIYSHDGQILRKGIWKNGVFQEEGVENKFVPANKTNSLS